ncbi:Uncharacterised protein [Mycobacteroides abscessus subsp. abscessus]|nr:Uncharacterised protein [Mycobacteroides abscessus subsp. abscessus]
MVLHRSFRRRHVTEEGDGPGSTQYPLPAPQQWCIALRPV